MEQLALQKTYLGMGAGFVTSTAIASQGCTWKVLNGVGAAFHVKWLLAVWAHPSQLRPAWNKPFSSPSPLGLDWVVSLLSAVSVLTSNPLARLIIPLVTYSVTRWTPNSAHFRCPRLFSLFPPSLLTSHSIWHSPGSLPTSFVSYIWPLKIDVIFQDSCLAPVCIHFLFVNCQS